MSTYNTKQKELLISIIKNQKKEFTIKDIHNKVKYKTGLTTIYRLVDKLTEEGLLNKYIGKDNITYYQYLDKCNHDNHFFLKCNECGNIIHIDCDCISELFNHIISEHNFKPSHENIIIKGICNGCNK